MYSWLTIPFAWLGADLLHFAWIAARRSAWERITARAPDGLRADAAAFTVGQGPVAVLLVHGFADVPAVFHGLATELAAGGGLTCRAMRLPGAGEPLAAAARVTEGVWLEAVTRETRELRRTHARVWLLGHSLGGALVLAAVLKDPGLADGIVVLAPLLRVSRARSPVLPPRVWFRLAWSAFLFSRTFESCFATDVTAVDVDGWSYRRDRFIQFATYRSLFTLLDWLQPRATALRLPVLAILAGRDRVVDNAATRNWLSHGAAPRLVVDELPDTPHPIPTEPGWKEVTRRVRSFIMLDTVPSGSALGEKPT